MGKEKSPDGGTAPFSPFDDIVGPASPFSSISDYDALYLLRQLLQKHKLKRDGVGRRLAMWHQSDHRKGPDASCAAFTKEHVRISKTLLADRRPSVAIVHAHNTTLLKFNREIHHVKWLSNPTSPDDHNAILRNADDNELRADLTQQLRQIDRRTSGSTEQQQRAYASWASSH